MSFRRKKKDFKEIAECIYVGIIHDTGVFQYSSTSAKTMNVAGRLMNMGIDFTEIVDKTFIQRHISRTVLWVRHWYSPGWSLAVLSLLPWLQRADGRV